MSAVAEQLEQSIEWVDDELIRFVGTMYVDETEAVEIITEKANRAFYYHELRGVLSPKISREGRVLDSSARRQYSITEIELLLTLPSTQRFIAELRDERAREAAAEKKAAKAVQLAEARRIKQARGEASLVPMLYAKVQEQKRVIDALLKTVASLQTGNASVVEAVGELSRPLPQVD